MSVIFLALMAVISSAYNFQANEVSILFPLNLPKSIYWSTKTQGGSGTLLPEHYLNSFAELLPNQREEAIRSLRVIAIRVDPCFVLQNSSCEYSLRLIWQPIDRNGVPQDAAIHTFYRLNNENFRALIASMNVFKRSHAKIFDNQQDVLTVSQSLTAMISDEKTLREYLEIFLKYVGERNLVQVTFTASTSGHEIWLFGGVDLRSGQTQAIVIPRANDTLQLFRNSSRTSVDYMGAGVVPLLDLPDSFSRLFKVNFDRPSMTEDEIRATVETVRKVEHLEVDPQNFDCVSCHVTAGVRFVLSQNHLDGRIEKFNTSYSIENLNDGQSDTTSMRVFGYNKEKPAVGQRVINETVRVLETINRLE